LHIFLVERVLKFGIHLQINTSIPCKSVEPNMFYTLLSIDVNNTHAHVIVSHEVSLLLYLYLNTNV